jgi:hypothetical protein
VAGATPAHTARRIGEPVPSLREYRPDLPDELAACIDACLQRDPRARPSLVELHDRLHACASSLDGEGPVPDPRTSVARPESVARLRVGQLVALTAWGLAVAMIAAPAGRPGLALVLGALTAPGIIVASRLQWACAPLLAPLLGALLAAPVYAAVAGARGTARERAVVGALGWCWLVVGAAAFGLGPDLGVAEAPPGWSRSTADAAAGLLSPLLTPEALLGAVVFALAAVALGLVLRAGHVPLAVLGALLWAAGLEGALSLVADGALAGRPVAIAAAGIAAVIVEFRRRPSSPAGRRAPIPGVRPAIQA